MKLLLRKLTMIANLGLYHLVNGNQVESDRFYRSLLNAPKEMIEMGIKDLEDLREWRIENDELRIEEAIPFGRLRQRGFEGGDRSFQDLFIMRPHSQNLDNLLCIQYFIN